VPTVVARALNGLSWRGRNPETLCGTWRYDTWRFTSSLGRRPEMRMRKRLESGILEEESMDGAAPSVMIEFVIVEPLPATRHNQRTKTMAADR
jgi:hypothetical protein